MVEGYGDSGGKSLETEDENGSEFWRYSLNILRNLLAWFCFSLLGNTRESGSLSE